jgi:TetR/AcrR family transcriptional regulator, transcriptional repressor for nem operon
MRYPAEHKQHTRARIVRAAARRFRSRGSAGAAIADLMRDLHLTHGGFYRHFRSKEDLLAEAFGLGLQEVGDRVVAAVEQAPRGGELKALIDAYLSVEHCENVAQGCPVAALVSEVARRPRAAREAFQRALRNHVTRMAAYVSGATPEERVSKAILLFSGMAGTLSIARATNDERERRRVLDEARRFYLSAAGV